MTPTDEPRPAPTSPKRAGHGKIEYLQIPAVAPKASGDFYEQISAGAPSPPAPASRLPA